MHPKINSLLIFLSALVWAVKLRSSSVMFHLTQEESSKQEARVHVDSRTDQQLKEEIRLENCLIPKCLILKTLYQVSATREESTNQQDPSRYR